MMMIQETWKKYQKLKKKNSSWQNLQRFFNWDQLCYQVITLTCLLVGKDGSSVVSLVYS